jgi:hypothetical protein
MVYTFTAEALNRIRKQLTTEIKNQIDSKKLNATGRLRNSVKGTVFASSKSISLNIYAAEYFESVDKGTKPGNKPPYSKIAEWVYRKGLNPYNKKTSKLRMIKSIQEAILEKGTIERFGYKGADILKFIDKSYADQITEEVKKGYLKDLESQININGNS